MCTVKAGALVRASARLTLGALIGACGLGPINQSSPAARTAVVAPAAAYERMAPCPNAPHCVSSLATDADHHAEPLHCSGSREKAQSRLLELLKAQPRTTIVANEPGYVRAEVSSALLRFTDDLEFQFADAPPTGGLIQVRSSSRVGYYDFGVNRARVEALRAAFAEATAGN